LIERTRCAVQPHPDRVGVRLVGELDVSNRTVIHRVLAGFAGTEADVYLDLARLTFIDVGAFTALAAFAQQHQPHRVVLQQPSSLIARLVSRIWPECGLELDPAAQPSSEQVW
jgi:ABC-type transporter Mla MlaB component